MSAGPNREHWAARLDLFSNRDFTSLWAMGSIANIVRWLEMLVISIYVFDVTGSAFQVALMTIMRMAPLALGGIFAGALAERFDRRKILFAGYSLSTAIAFTLALLAFVGHLDVWHLAVGSFLNGIVWTTDFPARRTLLGEVAGQDNIGTAMSLDTLTGNGTRMVGPALGGLALEALGIGPTFLIAAVLQSLTIVIALRFHHEHRTGDARGTGVWRDMLDGLRHVRSNRPLMGTLMVTVAFNVFGFPVTSMIPVIGADVLGLSPFPVGLLSSADGLGAFIGGSIVAAFATPQHFKKIYLYGTFTYLNMVLLFSSGTIPWLSGGLLVVMGLGAAGFSAMQATLAYLHAAPEYRSRVMGVLTVCIGTGPIGFAHVGLLADALGPSLACAIMAIEGIACLLLVVLIWPEVD
ncbi:MAG: MFS transporter [Chromatiales bacterium]|jgi:MFS family permease|nr:MFS transporter [Chromatiales bacterium]